MSGARWLVGFALPMVAACAWWASGRPTEVGEARVPRLNFNHSLHIGFDMECSECHGAVEEATTLAGDWLPAEAVCLDCHDRDTDCEACHSDPASVEPRLAVGGDDRILRFSHARHVGEQQAECTTCHTDVMAAEALPLQKPEMDTCLGCHNHEEDFAQAQCFGCHETLRVYPLTAVAAFQHTGDWLGRHGVAAEGGSSACLQCHTETICSDCHSAVATAPPARYFPEQVERSLMHRAGYVDGHAAEARLEGDLCARCHQTTFCSDCHTESDLSHAAADPFAVHPAGWLDRSSPEFHGPAARDHIERCAACHDQGPDSDCVDCHRSGRGGGNPHPPEFLERRSTGEVRSDPMCQVCHTEAL